jgi:hypothetical protein
VLLSPERDELVDPSNGKNPLRRKKPPTAAYVLSTKISVSTRKIEFSTGNRESSNPTRHSLRTYTVWTGYDALCSGSINVMNEKYPKHNFKKI